MADTQVEKVDNKGKAEGKGKKRTRVNVQEAGDFVDLNSIPSRTRNDFWGTQIDTLRANAGKAKPYVANSSTTASYLKARYGLVTTTRARADGKVDLFVSYPAKNVDGQMVPDEAEVAKIKAKHAPNKDSNN